ncbi:7a0ea0a1-12f5-4c30-84f1-047378809f9d [Thermothielavioides terrestris]|uniref:7a0ea0a1-12f5-4c30-84f1-047378809f9d n=1 Tax=Thermothielavioides terrestris TaxID=2587410 RepID=A0A446BTK8_9PEZI|nr:7a0ea0a1-12f5-4c30-84f1-047378809f9d [Thermothielavioides terrestris]
MVQPGVAGLDTPRTNAGEATYLSRQPDFDISQELSFQSPSKDANLLHQLRNGGRPTLKTPRGSRAPFNDRRNLPAGLGGPEFTPLLKSATRNSARRYGVDKENGRATPGFLAKIDEDMTPMPAGETSMYGASRNTSSFMDNTPLPEVDSSSVASTPLVMRRREHGKGPLEDGNQLSLREQENVIDKIEKENFGLKLKIHFLEEALRKAGPGFSEAALKENTELKVDKVTMQRELQRYKKHLTAAEKDLENYQQQILELQEKAKRKFADENQRAEMERLRQELEDKDAEMDTLQRRLEEHESEHDKVERLQDEIGDLEADLRRKDDLITQHEDEIEELREKVEDAEEQLKKTQRRVVELEEKAQDGERLQEARDTIEELEANIRRLEQQVDDMRDKLEDAVSQKDRAEADLEELQEEMANKSVVTKGLSRQLEEKVARLQAEAEKARQECASLEQERSAQQKEIDGMREKLKEAREERDSSERLRLSLEAKMDEEQGAWRKEMEDVRRQLKEARQERDSAEHIRLALEAKLEQAHADLNLRTDEKALLQTRHDALTSESSSLQREISNLRKSVAELEESLEQERQHAVSIEREIRAQFQSEIERLNNEISDLQAECREKDNLYDNDSEKWEAQRHNLEAERDRAEERAAGLQRTIDKLRDAEGALSSKETKLQEALQSETERHQKEVAILSSQIDQLQQDLNSRQAMLEELRHELSAVKDELRQSQLDCASQREKAEALEDEVEILQAAFDEESEKARLELDRAHDADLKTIRELERRVEDYEAQLAALRASAQGGDGNSELSSLQRELSAARKKEIEQLKHDASQKETIKLLKRQIADLERQAHEAALDRFVTSPSSHGGSAQKAEIAELRHRLSTANQSVHDLKRSLRDAERKASASARELQKRLDELEDEKVTLEQALEDARTAAEEAAAAHEEALNKYKKKLEKYKRERDELAAALRDQRNNHSANSSVSEMTLEERRDLHQMLRESQVTADKLDRELREHREALEELMGIESSLRKKLERARSERAAYRASAEKLQKDFKKLQIEKDKALAEAASAAAAAVATSEQGVLARASKSGKGGADTDAIIRAAEAAEKRHEKEIRGMVMQMEWLKACWDRESRLRKDAAYAKQYLMMEVQIRDACNKADLAIINRIRDEIHAGSKPGQERQQKRPASARRSESDPIVRQSRDKDHQKLLPRQRSSKLRLALNAVRFIARMQIRARDWAKYDRVRQRLSECIEDMEREQRIRRMRDQWRAEMGRRAAASDSRGAHVGMGC